MENVKIEHIVVAVEHSLDKKIKTPEDCNQLSHLITARERPSPIRLKTTKHRIA